MSETRKHRQHLLEDDGYIPPPSVFADRGFAGFSSAMALPAPQSAGLSVQELIEYIEPAPQDYRGTGREASLDDDEPLWPQPAPPAEQVSFNELILGRADGGGWTPDDTVPVRYDGLATAALVVSLSGLVTAVGFPVGVLMGHAARRRIGDSSWYYGTAKAERRARNAIMIGYVGMAVLAAAALLAAAWWFLQTPVETLLPGPEVTDTGITTAHTDTEGTP